MSSRHSSPSHRFWHVYKVQRPINHISKVLSDCETCYNQVQKILYDVLITKAKLIHFFESHPICVVTSYGLREIIRNSWGLT
jgi:hypothetical protein